MTASTMQERRPTGRLRSSARGPRLVAAACGALTLFAGVVGAPVAANATALTNASVATMRAPTTAVHGTVTLGGHAVAHAAVGTWSPTRGTLSTSHTDARGRFTLHTPRGLAAYAFAGAAPSRSKAVFPLGTRHLVRGVIGAHAPLHLADALYEGIAAAAPSKLGGGHPLHFRLQRAGRFSGASPELGAFTDVTGSVLIQRGSGVYSDDISATAQGSFTSPWLVPGRYHLFWDPKPEVQTARSWVTVRPGSTTRATTPDFVAHHDVPLTVHVVQSSAGPQPGAAVPDLPVLGVDPHTGVAGGSAGTTDATGSVLVRDATPRTHTFSVGTYYVDPDEGLQSPDGQPTSNDWLPKRGSVTVEPGAASSTVTIAVDPAAHLTGSVAAPAAAGDERNVVAETSAGVPVRKAFVPAGSNSFDLGGLPAGTYQVIATEARSNGSHAVYATSARGTVSAGGTAAVPGTLAPARAEPVVSGTVASATSGTVSLRSAVVYLSSAHISKKGRYSLPAIPGKLALSTSTPNHLPSRRVPVTVSAASITKNLGQGVAEAKATARFMVHHRPVKVAVGATDGVEGHGFALEPTGHNGRSTASFLVPGHYGWAGTPFVPLAVDGPWYYSTPTGTFTLKAGATKDLGTKHLTIRH